MNFNLGATKGAVEAGRRLTPGIHNAKFLGIEKNTIESRNGDSFEVMTLKLDVDGYGEWSQNFFEPTSDERTQGTWGPQASQQDHFLIAVREILSALDPKIIETIDAGLPIKVGDKECKLGGSFTQFVNAVKVITRQYVGADVEIKLIPQNNGFVSLPTFCARITRAGNVGISTTFIGHDLTLSPSEKKKIDNANNAAPTNMASTASADDAVAKMKADLSIDDPLEDTPTSSESDSDLPF